MLPTIVRLPSSVKLSGVNGPTGLLPFATIASLFGPRLWGYK
jgi:hypothetical protein